MGSEQGDSGSLWVVGVQYSLGSEHHGGQQAGGAARENEWHVQYFGVLQKSTLATQLTSSVHRGVSPETADPMWHHVAFGKPYADESEIKRHTRRPQASETITVC